MKNDCKTYSVKLPGRSSMVNGTVPTNGRAMEPEHLRQDLGSSVQREELSSQGWGGNLVKDGRCLGCGERSKGSF